MVSSLKVPILADGANKALEGEGDEEGEATKSGSQLGLVFLQANPQRGEGYR